MAERARTAASAARYGFTDTRADGQLRAAGWWEATGPAEGVTDLLAALSRAADPDLALRGLDRLREADEEAWPELDRTLRENRTFRGRLFAVLGTSTALSDFLAAHPAEWRCLVNSRCTEPAQFTERLLDRVRGEDGAYLTGFAAEQALRAAYRGLLLGIAATDLGHLVEPGLDHPPFKDVGSQLTVLAEAALTAGLAVAETEVGAGTEGSLAVIAMGKTGGRELNYVSDVDVIFVGAGDLSIATRLASTMMRVVGKACFEVDAALRPEGKSGALVRTLEGHTAYYRKWAKTWEFQALLKARPVAGDAELGRQYAEMVAPMVWSAADRENFVTEVQQMRRRVERHLPEEHRERELKLGRGGLRDVEFAVQLLQLVHGRIDPELHSTSTLEALDALGHGGYVGREDAAEMAGSYEFLRTVEHRLQLRQLRRTHLFPEFTDTDELRILARACGIRGVRGRSQGETLLAEFRRHAKSVRRLHEKLFYRPLLQSVANVPTEALRLTTKQAASRLAALGFAAPEGALQHIKALTAGVSRRAAIQQALLPVLLDLLADTPDPDGGLLSYRKVSEALEETPWYLRVLRDEGTVVERLAFLLGTSRLVPDLLVRAPEVLQLLGDPARLIGRDPADVAKSLRATVRRQPGINAAVAAARSLRRHELLRVASADLLGLLDVPAVCAALSSIWVAVLQGALAAAYRQRQAELGRTPATVAVIAMGRLGGAELGYGSDADVLFVCEPAEGVSDSEAVKFASSVAETVRKMLGAPSSDPALVVDADLRPEGRSGALVRTLESYRAYYTRWGEVWEAQALLRARFVAGDDDLGERFIRMIDPVRYPEGGLDAKNAREIRRIKVRVETERMPRGADPTRHTKLGRGGLADVEWTVQLLQLQHAHEVPGLRTTSTLDGLTALADAGLAPEGSAESLREAWLLATRVRNAGMLVRGKAVDEVPSSGRDLAAVARVFGYSPDDDPGEFLDHYRRVTRRAHAVVEELFYEN
ncbi:bifunctional [glutamine synthetase] adenylyltransferase/[glutamine synthetase]-adenylyl-L-tyrosine phosphorylase [Amycolatopsis sp. PS_44_ISF1]|uniref:bifunctional [glutamine synthetase] adenylyltransferase/[glutamine synthetase]-adenylyl-L-tyrosine phosphorylase n=1 Tax=Amycolatopsis sp. PS_44_ISF1 TaxID=2974917 RepID=UPI0028E04E89|nr:bifunctional [glutamine synthetase] adenylyltransferase/[glutamine synthetase]-adenylyl-L-tyrosine phosphorylase [Amycolatopsis sp. PS_44_ISF1]MDT8915822.1 bifunctional [glutamine synthetase] adenylyltransferase/[glutamine synthetase]-adenylyl-L-tyrosine phosphorylase [Amycolatopsis sp. PS_44_ISF1]